MAVFIKSEDYEFIQVLSCFREKIGKHISMLNIDPNMLEVFNNETDLFMHVFANEDQYKTCSQSFIKVNLARLRLIYTEIVFACKSSRRYNTIIGRELGIEKQASASAVE